MVSRQLSKSMSIRVMEGEVESEVEARQEEVDVEHPCSRSEMSSASVFDADL